jgi:tight adherence protein C
MREPVVLSGLVLWGGLTMILAEQRWFARTRLVDRLRPHAPEPSSRRSVNGLWSVESFREVIGPLARSVGEAIAGAFGVVEDVGVRLERVHSPLDATAFRVRQLGWAIAGFGVAAVATVALRLPAVFGLFSLAGAPLVAFLVLEQRLAVSSAAWQRRIFLELPVVSEQLAMLLNAGYSLGGALNRVAARGRGACARDLAVVCGRVRHGLTESEALAEWAARAKVDALDRLLPVLSRAGHTSDLGRLLSVEAHGIRRDVQRDLLEALERRAQQVWVPVTVATLVPGVIFLSIPFIAALRQFSGP